MSTSQQQDDSKRQAAREVIDILHDISVLLNTNLDRTQLSLCVSLLENGVHPEALANVIKMLRNHSNASPPLPQVSSSATSAATIAGRVAGDGGGARRGL